MVQFSVSIPTPFPVDVLIGGPGRMIGTIIPDVVLRERHYDRLVITDHPVEVGATISDHAYKLPVEVEMECGWSDSTAMYDGAVQEVYAALLALQAEREPFDLVTGKKSYSNMLIAELIVTTDQTSEFILAVLARFKQVIITSTSSISIGSAALQLLPQQTGLGGLFGALSMIPSLTAPTLVGAIAPFLPLAL